MTGPFFGCLRNGLEGLLCLCMSRLCDWYADMAIPYTWFARGFILSGLMAYTSVSRNKILI